MSKPLQILAFRPLRKGTLAGFVSVEFGNGLQLVDCTVHAHPGGRQWVGLPGKPWVDPESGQLHRDPRTGKVSYVAIAKWRDPDIADRFSEIVINQPRQRGDLDGGAA
jgi:hypothetical protein